MGFSDLEAIMKDLLDNGKYSDLTISCEGIDFKVHRAVICSQSSFFDAAVSSGFREAALSRVNLPEDDVETITRVLTFCYLQDYNAGDTNSDLDSGPSKTPTDQKSGSIAHNNLRVYLAADKFNIPLLKNVASERLISWANMNWNSANFPGIVRDIWCGAPPHEVGLRDAITGIVSSHIQHFLAQRAGKSALIENPELAVAALKRVADREAFLKAASDKRRQRKMGLY